MNNAFAFRLGMAALAGGATGLAQTAPATLDTRPAFMAIVTNVTFKTNLVIVTNTVVAREVSYSTNYYNAQGQLLQPVKPPPIPGLIPIPPAAPAAPDPAVVKAAQAQAVKDLLSAGVATASNKLCAAGSFTNDLAIAIQIPEGVTVFDRKKGQALFAAMNRAAEKAAPESLAAVQRTVSQLKLDNPAQILQGNSDAATSHLNTAEGQNLAAQVLPIVQRAATAAGVDQAYQEVMLKGGGLFGAVLGTTKEVDINAHLTRGLLQAILKSLAAQESVVRADPAARKTRALQDAFKK